MTFVHGKTYRLILCSRKEPLDHNKTANKVELLKDYSSITIAELTQNIVASLVYRLIVQRNIDNAEEVEREHRQRAREASRMDVCTSR